jgi:hypothetical protein
LISARREFRPTFDFVIATGNIATHTSYPVVHQTTR